MGEISLKPITISILQKLNPAIIDLAKEMGIGINLWPGGCGTHFYDWKKTIGPGREKYWTFGLDEFLKWHELVSSGEVVITISFFTGTAQDAADQVEYLNSPNDGSNPGGGTDWAKIRADNGHPEPYKVKYFEYGNESYHGDHINSRGSDPVLYAKGYDEYNRSMKKIDPTIKFGIICDDHYASFWSNRFNYNKPRLCSAC